MNETLLNTSVKTTVPDMNVQVQTLPDLSDLIQFKDGIINIVNDILHTIAPNFEIQLIAIFAILLGVMFKKKYGEDWTFSILVIILIYGTLRWIGIGG